jgi:(1->4)-alpha-D-glucan 1-alpha-D-glucosylmutase
MTPDRQRARPAYVPLTTYRLQLHPGFTLADAQQVVPYLAALGIGTCYTSPYFTAAPGSTHGYDVANHNEINPELGGAAAHDAFTAALKAHGLGHIVDFVPNHMGVGDGANAWWNDVLENGPGSPSAAFFDIDWAPVKPELTARLLLPILGDQYGRVLERGELQLVFRDGRLKLTYGAQELPINAREASRVLRRAIDPLVATLGDTDPAVLEFQSIVASLQNLPPYIETRPEQVAERQREKDVARTRLARLVGESPDVGSAVEDAVRAFNGEAGRPESFNALHDLLEAQPYRLSYWRTASHEINYRRFFDVNTLAGLRIENPDVFAATHQLIGALIRDGKVQAIRIDHPDGLFDPVRYFDVLQDLAADGLGVERHSDTDGRPDRPFYVVAEKILSTSEKLPARWAVHGTTGYNYLNELNGLFINAAQARRMRRAYARLTGSTDAFIDERYASKRLIMDTAMASELNVLAHVLNRISESNRRSRDFTLDSLRLTITEVVACFPVYRTYVDEHGWAAEDRAVVEHAIVEARRRNPAMESSLFDFFREVMLARDPDEATDPRRNERRGGYPPADASEARDRLAFAMRFQQYTAPVQAKGLEDTAFYRYNMLLSLNEVGGNPDRFGRTVEEFHEANQERLRVWPFEMITTSTHDTKLGEDVRARLNVLSEIPDDWAREAGRWMQINRTQRTLVDGAPAPDRNEEQRFYQAVLGVWPNLSARTASAPADLVERLQAYMLKSVKEAKVHSSWLTPNQAYEDAIVAFVARVLTGAGGGRFLAAFAPFARRVARLGLVNSLAQLTLKLGSPGIPDIYQGAELWDLSLVDPDNRRPVDFARRADALADIEKGLALQSEARAAYVSTLLESWPDGRIKLLLTAAGLRLRREEPELFLSGDYVPLDTDETVHAGVVAFARVLDDRIAIFAAPRLCAPLVDDAHPVPLGGERWKTSRILLPHALAGHVFRDELTGAEIRPTANGGDAWIFAGQVFERVPVGLLRIADGR